VAIVIRYSAVSKQDLAEIYYCIARNSKSYALKEVRAIRNRIAKLKQTPLVGKPFDEFEPESLRELVFRNYRIIYEVRSPAQIYILTVHHHARYVGNNPAFSDDDL
jgi:toxin ParE1/3/4